VKDSRVLISTVDVAEEEKAEKEDFLQKNKHTWAAARGREIKVDAS